MTREAIQRAPEREPARTPIRERKRKGSMIDQYYVDPSKIPEGQDWNWKRVSVYGKEDRNNQTMMSEFGWEPVCNSVVNPGGAPGPVERDGMMLMERPIELTREAQAEEARDAADRLAVQELKFKSAMPADPTNSPKTRPLIKRSIGSLEVAE